MPDLSRWRERTGSDSTLWIVLSPGRRKRGCQAPARNLLNVLPAGGYDIRVVIVSYQLLR